MNRRTVMEEDRLLHSHYFGGGDLLSMRQQHLSRHHLCALCSLSGGSPTGWVHEILRVAAA